MVQSISDSCRQVCNAVPRLKYFMLGRSSSLAPMVFSSEYSSRKHIAVLNTADGQAFVVDLRSTRGTFMGSFSGISHKYTCCRLKPYTCVKWEQGMVLSVGNSTRLSDEDCIMDMVWLEDADQLADLVVTLTAPPLLTEEEAELTCTSMSGNVLAALRVKPATETVGRFRARLAAGMQRRNIKLALQDGRILSDNAVRVCSVFTKEEPDAPRKRRRITHKSRPAECGR